MPKNTAELIETLTLQQWDANTLRGSHPRTYLQRSYGGQVLAQALLAAHASMPDERLINSLHAYFLRSGRVDRDIDYEVEIMRDGGSFSTRRITASQGEPIFAMSAQFHLDEPGLDHSVAAPRVDLEPDECRPFLDVMNERFGESPMWHEWDALDVRFIGDSNDAPPSPLSGDQARMQVWIRTEGPLPDDPRMHLAALAYLSDLTLSSVASLPHDVAFLSNQLQVASLSHSMWFHRPARADEWLLYDMVSPSAAAAIGFCTGRLFQAGKLVASCSQEGLIRVVDDRPLLT